MLAASEPDQYFHLASGRQMAEQGLARAIPLDSTPQLIAQAILDQLRMPLQPPDFQLPTWEQCTSRLLDLYQTVIEETR